MTTDAAAHPPAADGAFLPALDYVQTYACDALLVVQQGRVVLQYGDLAKRYMCHSMRKSFLSALFGREVQRDPALLSRTLAQLEIDDRQGLSAQERQATVHDLLAARSGIYHPAGYETPWMRAIKPPRHSAAPGVQWCYSNWDFNALGTIYRQVTGRDIHAAFKDEIADPIGMQDFRYDATHRDGELVADPCSMHPAYPFRLSTRDLARFGQLFLDGGRHEGHAIVDAHWVQASLLPYSHAGDLGAYGYMWWLARDGVAFPHAVLPAGAFHAMGAGGHYCVVLPSLQAVIVHRVDTDQPGRSADRYQVGRLLRLLMPALGLRNPT